ncbi:MAG TPA: nicotinate-nucleotide adenylyltransferase [Caulobacteraceae bacterium]
MSLRPSDLKLRPGQAVGLFGGSFDPPHEGHLHVARTALRRLGLDRVVWLVSPGNPLKGPKRGDLERRLRLAREITRGRGMMVSGAEAELGTRYTLETVRALKRLYPGVRFVWIMGGDGLAQFHRWRGWEHILREVPVAVIARPGYISRARLSPAARRFAFARVPAARARLLPRSRPPTWAYLQPRWNHASSTALRSRLR